MLCGHSRFNKRGRCVAPQSSSDQNQQELGKPVHKNPSVEDHRDWAGDRAILARPCGNATAKRVLRQREAVPSWQHEPAELPQRVQASAPFRGLANQRGVQDCKSTGLRLRAGAEWAG